MSDSEKYLVIGRFGKTNGLKGWLRLNSETQPASNILNYRPWLIESKGSDNYKQYKELNLAGSTVQADSLLVHIEGFDNPEDAQTLVGKSVLTERTQLPELSAGEFYWADLEGLEVFTTAEESLGTVDYLIEAGACDVMVIKGSKERLIPFDQQSVVKTVDLQLGRIIVDWDVDF